MADGAPPGSTRLGAVPPLVVAVGAASRDVAGDDERGWRLGGGVVYGALALARLGLRVVAYLGLEEVPAQATELDLLGRAGVEVRPVRLERGARFENREGPAGRRQRCLSWPTAIAPRLVDDALAGAATGWLFAPIAAELPGGWGRVPRPEALVALGWQGLLRRRLRGDWVGRRPPRPNPLLARADLVGVSVEDLGPRSELGSIGELLRATATLVVTAGERGGLVGEKSSGGWRWRRYRAVPCQATVAPTGAGDVFLAVLLATRLAPRLVGGRIAQGGDLVLAAAAASLSVEGRGIEAVPDLAAVRARLAVMAARGLRSSGSPPEGVPT